MVLKRGGSEGTLLSAARLSSVHWTQELAYCILSALDQHFIMLISYFTILGSCTHATHDSVLYYNRWKGLYRGISTHCGDQRKSSNAQKFREAYRHPNTKLCSGFTSSRTSRDIWPMSSCVNGWTSKTFTETAESVSSGLCKSVFPFLPC